MISGEAPQGQNKPKHDIRGIVTPESCQQGQTHVREMGGGTGDICVEFRTGFQPTTVVAKIYQADPGFGGVCVVGNIPVTADPLTQDATDPELWTHSSLAPASCNAQGDAENWLVVWERKLQDGVESCQQHKVKFCGLCDTQTNCELRQ